MDGGGGVALKSYGIQGCTMMGGGGGCCSKVLWDTRMYHDGGGGVALKSDGIQGCTTIVREWGGGGGHGLSPRVRLITRVTKHASMPARFAGQPQKTYRHCTI